MKKLLIVTALVWVFMSSQALGTPVNFGDSTYYWSGWPSSDSSENSDDQIGTPIFPGTPASPGSGAGSYQINDINGKLERITFNYHLNGVGPNPLEQYFKAGDLFIDKGRNGTWDYLVRVYNQTAPENYNVCSVSLSSAGGTAGYILSDTSWTHGGDFRNGHPVATLTVPGIALQTAYFAGWISGAGDHSTYFDFGTGLDIGYGEFEFAWTTNCANDVIREHGSNPVSEPATMLLLASGLLGLAGIARKKFKK